MLNLVWCSALIAGSLGSSAGHHTKKGHGLRTPSTPTVGSSVHRKGSVHKDGRYGGGCRTLPPPARTVSLASGRHAARGNNSSNWHTSAIWRMSSGNARTRSSLPCCAASRINASSKARPTLLDFSTLEQSTVTVVAEVPLISASPCARKVGPLSASSTPPSRNSPAACSRRLALLIARLPADRWRCPWPARPPPPSRRWFCPGRYRCVAWHRRTDRETACRR